MRQERYKVGNGCEKKEGAPYDCSFFCIDGKGPELAVIILLLNNSRASPVLNMTGLLPSTGRGGDPA